MNKNNVLDRVLFSDNITDEEKVKLQVIVLMFEELNKTIFELKHSIDFLSEEINSFHKDYLLK